MPFLLDYLPELAFLSFLGIFLDSVNERVLDLIGLLNDYVYPGTKPFYVLEPPIVECSSVKKDVGWPFIV